jgi:hypothetical protein
VSVLSPLQQVWVLPLALPLPPRPLSPLQQLQCLHQTR